MGEAAAVGRGGRGGEAGWTAEEAVRDARADEAGTARLGAAAGLAARGWIPAAWRRVNRPRAREWGAGEEEETLSKGQRSRLLGTTGTLDSIVPVVLYNRDL